MARLIVCSDSTWNDAGLPSATNVAKVALSIRDYAGMEQRVYYQRGAGIRRWDRLRGGAFTGLSHNVLDAYRFLVHNYEPGDQLYLFGFSRGATTVRSLTGLVRNSGIVRNASRIKEAWALYRWRVERPDGPASLLFRRMYAHETRIDFIGVWDTVGALGIPTAASRSLSSAIVDRANRRWPFHDTDLSTGVKGAFHALAIDEQRATFRPTLWHQHPDAAEMGQELKQVWFTGTHADIGGGYGETALSDITLAWMIAQATRYGLRFDIDRLGMHVANPDPAMGLVHRSRSGLSITAPPMHRPIGKATDATGRLNRGEYLSETAKRRYDKDATYRPPELHRYLSQDEVFLEPVPLPPPNGDLEPTGPDQVPPAES